MALLRQQEEQELPVDVLHAVACKAEFARQTNEIMLQDRHGELALDREDVDRLQVHGEPELRAELRHEQRRACSFERWV